MVNSVSYKSLQEQKGNLQIKENLKSLMAHMLVFRKISEGNTVDH